VAGAVHPKRSPALYVKHRRCTRAQRSIITPMPYATPQAREQARESKLSRELYRHNKQRALDAARFLAISVAAVQLACERYCRPPGPRELDHLRAALNDLREKSLRLQPQRCP
jgi:hypothetical protein